MPHRSSVIAPAQPCRQCRPAQPNPWRTVHAFCHRLHRRLRPRHRGGLRDRPGRPDHGRGQTEGFRPVWRQHRACGLFQSGRRRQLVGHRRRRLPRRRCGGVRRRQGGQIHAAHRQGAVHRRAVRRGRRAVAQHHLDAQSRQRARARFRRRDLLRRPGLHGAQVARGQERARAGRRLGVRADRHHHRAQSRRLLPRQQHVVHPGGVRARRRSAHRVRARPLRHAHHRSVGPVRRAHRPQQPRRPHRAAGGDLEGAARAGGPPRRQRSGATSSAGRSMPWSTPKSSASPRRTSTT